jgi:hypothetical protein
VLPQGTTAANNRPSRSKATPVVPPVFSRNTEKVPALSILCMRFALISEKITLPSGIAMGPSVPSRPSFNS